MILEQLANLHRDIELLAEHQERVYEELKAADRFLETLAEIQTT